MWVFVFCFPLVIESVAASRTGSFMWAPVLRMWLRTLPYLGLFLVHEFIILPHLLRNDRLKWYILTALAILVLFGTYNGIIFHHNQESRRENMEFSDHRPSRQLSGPHPSGQGPGRPASPPDSAFPPPPEIPFFPVIIPTIMAMLLMGINLAVSLLFRYSKEQEVRKQLENMRLKDELKYLKSQVNPHFFMNMLNNIHALVETNPSKAQDMILQLSKLMRYVLYEGDSGLTAFRNEINFVSIYLDIMRQRYPAGKVSISSDLPSDPSEKIKIPPLIFICFLENAFKHGVSYLRKTEIEVSIIEKSGTVSFYCRNTKPKNEAEKKEGGFGLENVRRRLDLLYGSGYSLSIEDLDDEYKVLLIIPSL